MPKLNPEFSQKYHIYQEFSHDMVSQSFLATRKNSGDLFELKILSADMQSDKLQALTSFYKEFKHHNILSFLDSLQSENGEIALISEFKQGITLDRLFHHLSKTNKKMPVHLVSFIITEICTGLDYIHSRRMQQNGITNSNAYHGLQRENIFISNTGEIKIRSVELAALRYKFIKDNLNGSDEALHSIVAPEYFSNSAHIDFRADIYALGIIFLELLAGQKLPVNASPASLIDNIFKNNSAYFAERPIEVMDKLRSILGKILADNPDRRYAATNQLYMDLLHQLILTASNANFTQELADFIEESDIELLGSVLIPPSFEETTLSEDASDTSEAVAHSTEVPPEGENNSHNTNEIHVDNEALAYLQKLMNKRKGHPEEAREQGESLPVSKEESMQDEVTDELERSSLHEDILSAFTRAESEQDEQGEENLEMSSGQQNDDEVKEQSSADLFENDEIIAVEQTGPENIVNVQDNMHDATEAIDIPFDQSESSIGEATEEENDGEFIVANEYVETTEVSDHEEMEINIDLSDSHSDTVELKSQNDDDTDYIEIIVENEDNSTTLTLVENKEKAAAKEVKNDEAEAGFTIDAESDKEEGSPNSTAEDTTDTAYFVHSSTQEKSQGSTSSTQGSEKQNETAEAEIVTGNIDNNDNPATEIHFTLNEEVVANLEKDEELKENAQHSTNGVAGSKPTNEVKSESLTKNTNGISYGDFPDDDEEIIFLDDDDIDERAPETTEPQPIPAEKIAEDIPKIPLPENKIKDAPKDKPESERAQSSSNKSSTDEKIKNKAEEEPAKQPSFKEDKSTKTSEKFTKDVSQKKHPQSKPAPKNKQGFSAKNFFSKKKAKDKEEEPLVKILENPQSGINSKSASRFYSIIDDPAPVPPATDGEEIKTIIDVVRLSARANPKAFILGAAMIPAFFLLFTIVDTFAQMTPYGTGIYDYFFPPAIRIETIPGGAQVYLDDEPLAMKTPLQLEKIDPGVHKLKLTLAKFEPITKSFNVLSKGELHVAGEESRHGSIPYTFKFKVQLELSSQPPGATVYINNTKIADKTPTTVFWEIDKDPINIKMEKGNYPSIDGLAFDAPKDLETINDKRFWRFQRLNKMKHHIAIEGVFRKEVKIASIPPRAEIFVDDNTSPSGITGINGSLFFTEGEHIITLQKPGFISRRFSLQIDEESPPLITETLYRLVTITAQNSESSTGEEINATVVQIAGRGNTIEIDQQTPANVRLLPYAYTALIRKDDFEEMTIRIAPDDRQVVAQMVPVPTDVMVLVQDAVSMDAIPGVSIVYNTERSLDGASDIGFTDQEGRLIAKVPDGYFAVIASKDGYQMTMKSMRFQKGRRNRAVIRMKKVN